MRQNHWLTCGTGAICLTPRFILFIVMKRIVALLSALLLGALLFAQPARNAHLRVLSNTATEMVLQFDLADIDYGRVSTPRGEAVVPRFRGSTPLLNKGMPDVPKYAAAVRLAARGAWSVEVLGGDYEELTGVEVAPSKGNLWRTQLPSAVFFEYGAAYEEDAFYPGTLAEMRQTFVFRNVQGQGLWVYPVQYNPVRRVLRVYHSVVLRLKHQDVAGEDELTAVPVPMALSPAFAELQERFFVNGAPLVAAERTGGAETAEKILVIAPSEFIGELEPLIAWKSQCGLAVEVVTTEEIGSNKAEVVYNFVKQYYGQHGNTYLLLVGDDDAIAPVMLPFGDALFACDNCFGYLVGNDYLPEVLVGRLHATNPEQVRLMVRRILEYEKAPLLDPQADWMSAGMAAAFDEGLGYGDDGQADWQHANEWKANHLADGYTWYWEFYDGSHGADSPTPGHATADKAGDPVPSDLIQAIRQRGVSLFNYTGHGWEQGLSTGNFNTNFVRTLNNPGRYPILIAVGCSPGDFTGNLESLGEAWQRAGDYQTGQPWGGIAGFFSSVLQSWAPPMEAQDGMNQYLVDADGITLHPTIGAMAAAGYASMIAAYGVYGEEMAAFWNPFADPTTVPRTRFPHAIVAQHPDTIAFDAEVLTLSCPVEGAMATLYGHGRLLAIGRVSNGSATLVFDLTPGDGPLLLTLTQFNHLPYQRPIYLRPATQPYVVAGALTVSDAATGNGNGRLDYGEMAVLRAVVRNAGQGASAPLEAHVDAPAALITWLDTEAAVPPLGQGDSAVLEFRFRVREDVPHGSRADFTLTLSGGAQPEWTYSTYAILQAPRLVLSQWTLSSMAGANSRYLHSDEVARLYLQVRNQGGSESPVGVAQWASLPASLSAVEPLSFASIPAGGATTIPLEVRVEATERRSLWCFPEVALSAGPYHEVMPVGPFVVNPILETFETGNFQQFGWQRSGHRLWQISAQMPYSGKYCVRLAGLGMQQHGTLQLPLKVMEDSWVSFAYRLKDLSPGDSLYFLLDGMPLGRWATSQDVWQQVRLPVPAGEHTLAWAFRRGSLAADVGLTVFLDEIVLPPFETAVSSAEPEAPAELGGLRLWPNPAAEVLWWQLDDAKAQVLRVEVCNALGQLTYEQGATPQGDLPTSLPVRHLVPGVYQLRLHTTAGEVSARFIVKR